MASCKDCIHYDVCEIHDDNEFPSEEIKKFDCPRFKNKANYVEVVRCKDCDVPHNKWTGCPHLNGLIPPPNHYCACGVRKDIKREGEKMRIIKDICDHCGKELDSMHDYGGVDIEVHTLFTADLCNKCFKELDDVVEEFINRKKDK